MVVQVWEGMLVSELRADIARRVHASPGHCCVTRGGKLFSVSSTLEAAQVVKGSCVDFHARGVGGSVPGEWFCNHCNRRGSWPARQRCFRCGLARSESEALRSGGGGGGKGGKAKGKGGAPQRETSYPGRGQSNSRARSLNFNVSGTMRSSIPLDVVFQLLEALKNLGVSLQVVGEVRAAQKARVVLGRGRRLAELEEQWLSAASHSDVLCEQMTRKEQEYLASVQRFEVHQKQVDELEAEYREAKILLRSPVHSVPHSNE